MFSFPGYITQMLIKLYLYKLNKHLIVNFFVFNDVLDKSHKI